jgi:hypothetical protein
MDDFEPDTQAFESSGRSDASTPVEPEPVPAPATAPKKTQWHRTVISFYPDTVPDLQDCATTWRRQTRSSASLPVSGFVRASIAALMPLFNELEDIEDEDALLSALQEHLKL